MGQSHVISGLVDKHSEISGQIEYHQKQIAQLKRDADSIGGAIKIIDPEFNLREIKAKQVKPQNRFFKSREASQLILEAFRDIGGDVATDDIQANVAQKKELDLDAMSVEDRKAFKATLFTIMKRMEKREVIQPVNKRGTVIVWRLLPSDGC